MAIFPVLKKLPANDLSLTNETAVTLPYGIDVIASFLPMNDLSCRITRRSVSPMNPVPTPTAS
jgi:hypothetical protein